MDSVALFVDKNQALSIIQALHEASVKCDGDGRRIMAENYRDIEEIMRKQYLISMSIRDNMDENGGRYVL